MPGECCAAIVSEEDITLPETTEILKLMWNWAASPEHVQMVKALFTAVFDRSAALAAVAIAAMAKKTEHLQPAMGGLTIGVDGSLYTQNEKYRHMLVKHLDTILGEDTAALINFTIATDGSGKGAGILAGAVTSAPERRSSMDRNRMHSSFGRHSGL